MEFHLRLLSLNAIAVVKVALRRLLSRCIWQVCLSVELRISQRHSGKLKSLREQSASWIRRPMPASKYGEAALRQGKIPIRLRRWNLSSSQLGRWIRKCGNSSCNCSQSRWFSWSIGAAEGMKEDKSSWVNFFQWMRERGLNGVKLIVGDKCLGMPEAVGEVFPEAKY